MAAPTFSLVVDGDVTRTFEAEFEGRTLVVQEDVLALSRMPWSYGVVDRQGYLLADGRALSQEHAEQRAVERASWL